MINMTLKKYLKPNIFIEAVLGSIVITGLFNMAYDLKSVTANIIINVIFFVVIYYLFSTIGENIRKSNMEFNVNREKLCSNIENLNMDINSRLKNIEQFFDETLGKLNISMNEILKSSEENLNRNFDSFNLDVKESFYILNETMRKGFEELNVNISSNLQNIKQDSNKNVKDLNDLMNEFASNILKQINILIEEMVRNNDKLIDEESKLLELCDNSSENNENLKDLINPIEDIKNLCYESSMNLKNQQIMMEERLNKIISGNRNVTDKYAQIQTSFSNELLKLIDKNQDIAKVLEVTVKTLKNVIEKI